MALIVNGENIGDDILEEEFDAIKDHYQRLGEVVCCDRDVEFRGFARENVLNRTLLRQESERRHGPPTDAEIDEMLDRLKAEHGGEEEFYKNTGYRASDNGRIRQRIGMSIAVDKVLEAEVGPDTDPTEEDLRGFYQENIAQYLTEEEVHVLQIMKEPKSHPDAKRCYKELREARERLLDGADFLETSAAVSDKADEATDLGWMKMGEAMPEIETIVFSLRTGEISPIVATHFGFHLFKVAGRKDPEPLPFEPMRDQIHQQYLTKRRETAINGVVEKLLATSTVEEIAGEEH
jgi:parvulin-like peptidyl-prolyl isomerase